MASSADMFRDGAPKLTPEEGQAVLKFLNSLRPGMLYVSCGLCGKFRQVVRDNQKNRPHPVELYTRLLLHVCEECK